ncbi:MAG: hypothetical protein BGO26_11630 [Actinobacteria bacterium 69-20]|nr:bifunctional diguanylate cyclase/phosphodiesterase [Actinomycetota bacterium]OJV26566.1 MAG: hypothetical protein BGO26_11630 [Actinobacteria bacterium 69-20]
MVAVWAQQVRPGAAVSPGTPGLPGMPACSDCVYDRTPAAIDELTGLASRATVMRRLAGMLARRAAPCRPSCVWLANTQIAVLFCDVDRFRVINESLGRDAGDKLLEVVARRLESTVEHECAERAMVGRVASDEYVVICDSVEDGEAALRLASRIHGTFIEPVQLGDDRLKVRVSIGVALATETAADAESLLRHAEAAAARAKSEGRDRIETFDSGMQRRAQDRLRTELSLAGACNRGEMLLHYQPILNLAEQRVTGLEALARWQHPERGLVPPAEFIPLAEETGLIRQLGDWVMEEAWAQCREWNRAGAHVNVGINISARQISQDGFVESVAVLLDRLGPEVQPHMEITESVLMTDPEASARKLVELRALGVRLSLDDFGTGYSSLAYLQKFPVHILKIDRSFVAGIERDPRQRAMVQAMVQLGHALDLLVLGEGVETEAERRVLEDIGCDLLQGFLIARPTPSERLPVPEFQ